MHNYLFRICLWVSLVACLGFTLSACQPGMSSDLAGSDAKFVGTYVEGQGKTGIRGRVVLKDDEKPLPGSYVNIYPDTISNLLGPSQFISTPTDEQGFYQLEVPEGVYYVVARKRMSGHATGPLAPGDYYSEHQRLAVKVKSGKLVEVDLPVALMKAPMFFKRMAGEETETGIKGVLVDQAGKPVMGGFAMAYSDVEMKRLPDYASSLSDEQGFFTIYLPQGGSYYLAARIHAWDMPNPGEPYGKYGDDSPVKVDVASGQFIEDIKIVMSPFSGVYKPGKSRRPF